MQQHAQQNVQDVEEADGRCGHAQRRRDDTAQAPHMTIASGAMTNTEAAAEVIAAPSYAD